MLETLSNFAEATQDWTQAPLAYGGLVLGILRARRKTKEAVEGKAVNWVMVYAVGCVICLGLLVLYGLADYQSVSEWVSGFFSSGTSES